MDQRRNDYAHFILRMLDYMFRCRDLFKRMSYSVLAKSLAPQFYEKHFLIPAAASEQCPTRHAIYQGAAAERTAQPALFVADSVRFELFNAPRLSSHISIHPNAPIENMH